MRRREFIELIATAALGFPRTGYAQTRTDLPLVGFLVPTKLDTATARERTNDLRRGLREGGYIEGENYALAVRSSEGNLARVQ